MEIDSLQLVEAKETLMLLGETFHCPTSGSRTKQRGLVGERLLREADRGNMLKGKMSLL